MASAYSEPSLAFEYQQGWSKDKDPGTVFGGGARAGSPARLDAARAAPQRTSKVSYDERQARKLVSRGQQKLLASAMILAATDTAQVALERPLLLLLDDPAAELDGDSLSRLLDAVAELGCQVVATSLEKRALDVPGRGNDVPRGTRRPDGRIRARKSALFAALQGRQNTLENRALRALFEPRFGTMRRLCVEDIE